MHVFDDFGDIVKTNEPLAPLAWFRLGGPAAYFARPRRIEELVCALETVSSREYPGQDPRGRIQRSGAR